MDLTKWKSVLLPKEIYQILVVVAKVEGRTLSGQLRVVFKQWLEENLSKKDMEYVQAKIDEFNDNEDQNLTSKTFSI